MTWRQHDINRQPHVVYRVYNAADALLYVGVAADFEARFRNHRSQSAWVPHYHRHELTWYPDRPQAESAEVTAIMTEHPQYNVAHNRPPREKPTRLTLDLDSARYKALWQFIATAGVRGSAAALLRALLDELQADPELAARVRARMARAA